MTFWQDLFSDPTAVGGIAPIAKAFGMSPLTTPPVGPIGSSVPMPGQPGVPAPTNQTPLTDLMAYFRPHSGLLGNSILGDALRGGLAGFGAATGTSGAAGIGAGFLGANDAAYQRQQRQMAPILGGQQYQSGQLGLQSQQQALQQGQQQLLSGNLDLAQSLAAYNYYQKQLHPGAPLLTMEDMKDPQKLANVMQAASAFGMPPARGSVTGGGTASPITPTIPPGGSGPRQSYVNSAIQPYADAFTANEGSGANEANKLTGASGSRQIIESTFNQYALPGEKFSNEADRIKASNRYIAHLYQITGGDPARMAVGYYSGEGNIAPAGSSTPYLNDISKTAKGEPIEPTSSYVKRYVQNFQGGQQGVAGNAGQAGQPGSTQLAQAGGGAGDQIIQAFTEAWHMTPQQMEQFGQGMLGIPKLHDQGMAYIKLAQEADPRLIYGKKALETQAIQQFTPHELRPGGGLYDSQGHLIGEGNPVRTEIMDPNGSGNKVPALQYPDGTTVTGKFANQAGDGPVSELGPYATKTQTEWADRRAEMGSSVNAGIQGEQRLTALGEALKATQSGSYATEIGKLKADLSAAGLGDFADKLAPNTSAADVQIATKDALQGVFSQIKSLVGSRVAAQEINLLATASANANLTPEANAKIISQGIGAIRYERALYDALSKASQTKPVDPNDFEIQFQKDHPLQSYIDAAAKDMGPLKGMGQQYHDGDTATNSQTGERLMYQAGKWVPYKAYKP